MKNIKLLDCTLRDGAYINNAKFGKESIINIVNGLACAGADIIECGWLKNDESNIDSTYFHVPSDINEYNFDKKDSKLALMIDYNRYDFKDIKKNTSDNIDMIRVTFPIDHIDEGIKAGEHVVDFGYDVSFQLTNAKSYIERMVNDEAFLKEFINKLNKLKPVCVCLADTFGSMVPNDIEYLVKKFDMYLDKNIAIGLHTHNNMGLAFANTLKIIDLVKTIDRDIVVDGSLLGMGRGAGNTPTEVVSDYLNKYEDKKYDIDKILDIIDKYMIKYYNEYDWGYSPYLAVAGMAGSHINNVNYLKDKYDISTYKLKKVLDKMDSDLKSKYKYDILDELYRINN